MKRAECVFCAWSLARMGWDHEVIAGIFGVRRETISRWVREHRKRCPPGKSTEPMYWKCLEGGEKQNLWVRTDRNWRKFDLSHPPLPVLDERANQFEEVFKIRDAIIHHKDADWIARRFFLHPLAVTILIEARPFCGLDGNFHPWTLPEDIARLTSTFGKMGKIG